MTKHEIAISRLEAFLEKGKNASGPANSEGPWSPADFDEIQMLAEFLGSLLPAKFHGLLQVSYEPYALRQRDLSNRLLRIMKFSYEFGLPNTEEPMHELDPVFSLKKQDRDRVLKLSTQMRKIVFQSSAFDDPHKRRLLNRVAAIEREVMQPNGRLDVILGGVSDIGDTVRKFGNDLEPLTKRIQEIRKIAQSNSKQYEQIPSPDEVKALPSPESANEEE